MKKILIFEPGTGGHHAEYLEILICYHLQHNHDIKLSLVINPKVLDEMTGVKLENVDTKLLDIIPLTNIELVLCNKGSLIRCAFMRWKISRKHAQKCGADHVLFLFLDIVQLPFAFHLPWPRKMTVSGILFQPSVHYKYCGLALEERVVEFIKRVRKKIVILMLLSNPAFCMLFTMDEYFFQYAKLHFSKSRKLSYIPDPALMSKEIFCQSGDGISSLVRNERNVLLLFGALTARKGIFKVLSAIDKLDIKTKKKITFIFAGKVCEKDKEEFYRKLNTLTDNPDNHDLILVIDRFLTRIEIVSLVSGCDMVLAPYQRFIGPSGVALWAASSKKPLITQNYGLLGAWVNEYKLGLSVDTTEPKEIASTITQAIRIGIDKIGDKNLMEKFIELHKVDDFAFGIYKNIRSSIK